MGNFRNLIIIQYARNRIQFVVDPVTIEELKPIVFFDAGKLLISDITLDYGLMGILEHNEGIIKYPDY
jgi:hypothetical protein